MKYHKFNFYKNTYCMFEMQQIDFFNEMKVHFQSKSGSYYYYTDEGVYRYSNHWGRVANCRWKINGIESYKNQNYYVGFSKWSNFYPQNDTDKLFYLQVNHSAKKVSIHRIDEKATSNFLMTINFAHLRAKQIQKLFTENKWAAYYDVDIEVLRKRIIEQLINSTKTIQQIKLEL